MFKKLKLFIQQLSKKENSQKTKKDILLDRKCKTYLEIEETWIDFQKLDTRNKIKRAAFFINEIARYYKNNSTTVEQKDFLINILNTIQLKIHRYDQGAGPSLIARIQRDRLAETGNAKIKILKKIRQEVQGGLSGIDIGDPAFAGSEYCDHHSFIERMNKGKLFHVNTEGDGLRLIELRIIDASEPVLSEKEMVSVVQATSAGVIDVSSDDLAIAATNQLVDIDWEYRIATEVAPGNYKIAVYQHKNDFLYVVMCKTNLEAKNNFTGVFGFNY
jgi:hypothetical protein